MEVVAVDAHTHARELPRQVVEDGARARVAEEVAEDVVPAAGERPGRVDAAGRIVLPPSPRVDQHRVGFADLLEAFGGGAITLVPIRMPREREPSIGLAD